MADGKYVVYDEGGVVKGYIKTFLIDTASDISGLPDDIPIGSAILILDTGDIKMLNNERQWVAL